MDKKRQQQKPINPSNPNQQKPAQKPNPFSYPPQKNPPQQKKTPW